MLIIFNVTQRIKKNYKIWANFTFSDWEITVLIIARNLNGHQITMKKILTFVNKVFKEVEKSQRNLYDVVLIYHIKQ